MRNQLGKLKILIFFTKVEINYIGQTRIFSFKQLSFSNYFLQFCTYDKKSIKKQPPDLFLRKKSVYQNASVKQFIL